MSLKKIQSRSLADLLATEPIAEENAATTKVIRRLQHVLGDGELSRGEFLDICYWKSPRGIRRCEKNSAATIERITQNVFAATSEKQKIELLTSLEGVSIPTASAILTLTDPVHYGVIDIRVWQLLYMLGEVATNARGVNFTYAHWERFLELLRHHAILRGVSTRQIELTLFECHRKHQTGNLY